MKSQSKNPVNCFFNFFSFCRPITNQHELNSNPKIKVSNEIAIRHYSTDIRREEEVEEVHREEEGRKEGGTRRKGALEEEGMRREDKGEKKDRTEKRMMMDYLLIKRNFRMLIGRVRKRKTVSGDLGKIIMRTIERSNCSIIYIFSDDIEIIGKVF